MKYLPLAILLSILAIIGFATIQISNKSANSKKAEATNEKKEQDGSFREVRIVLPEFSLSELFLRYEIFGKGDLVKKDESQQPESAILDDGQKNQASQPKLNSAQKSNRKKYSLINFFASWCTTCIAEHDILMRLQSENIIEIYGIAWRDIEKETKKFLKKRGNPYKKVGVDSSGLFTKIAAINAVPETWIVDENGIVVRRMTGNLDEFSLDEIRSFLQSH